MDILNEILNRSNDLIRPYMSEIVFAMIASLLIIYGDLITIATKKLAAKYNFLVRVSAFVLVAAFGFTLIGNFLTPFLADLLISTGKWLSLAVVGVFYIIGILAEKRGHA